MSTTTQTQLSVLLVEDHNGTRHAMTQLLRRRGHHVSAAGTVAEALAQLDGRSILILDLDLPDGKGTEVLRQVRARNLPIKVAVCSGSAGLMPFGELEALQPDYIFCKPVEFSKLARWLERAA